MVLLGDLGIMGPSFPLLPPLQGRELVFGLLFLDEGEREQLLMSGNVFLQIRK